MDQVLTADQTINTQLDASLPHETNIESFNGITISLAEIDDDGTLQNYAPIHEAEDAYVTQLAESLALNGWQGAPIVVSEKLAQQITGVHRVAAAHKLGWIAIPSIDLADIFAEYALDLDIIWEELFGDDFSYGDIFRDIVALQQQLPYEANEKYGLDLH